MALDYDESDNDSGMKTSKINSGLLQVKRLDELWKKANTYSFLGLYDKWNEILDRIWCELAGDLKTEDPRISTYWELESKYAKTLKEGKSLKGFKKPDNNFKENQVIQKKTLLEKEIFLRRMQNELGKGTAYDMGDDEYMDN